MSFRIFGTAALLAALAQAASVNVLNNCNFAVKATPSNEGSDHGAEYLQPGQSFTRPSEGSAWCLKLYAPGTDGQQWASKPTQLEWSTWENNGNTQLSYDLSDIDMGEDTTFLQHGMNLTSEDPTCDSPASTCRPAICKPQGAGQTLPCRDAYNLPYDTRTLGASASYDINMVLCTANEEASDDSSSDSAPAPEPQTNTPSSAAAAPAITPAPSVEQQANGNVVTKWVENTHVITQVVTARDAEPTLQKRYSHPHGHAHRHGA